VFNLSGSEIIVILLLALVVLGPEKLPDAMRRAGKTFAEIKKLSSGFQDEVRKGFEEPAREVKKTAASVKSAARLTTDTVTGKGKPRYNPATDPTPEPPEGSSVGEPLTDASADAAEAALAGASPDAAEAITADVPAESADAEDDGTAVGDVVVESDGDSDAVVADAAGDAEITPTVEADRTA
jgi:sec-independent protein translocase protein TatB